MFKTCCSIVIVYKGTLENVLHFKMPLKLLTNQNWFQWIKCIFEKLEQWTYFKTKWFFKDVQFTFTELSSAVCVLISYDHQSIEFVPHSINAKKVIRQNIFISVFMFSWDTITAFHDKSSHKELCWHHMEQWGTKQSTIRWAFCKGHFQNFLQSSFDLYSSS